MAIIDKPSDYFNTKLYSGNSTDDTSITGVGFQPDWLWIKERTNTSGHQLQDVIRGATKQLFSNETQAEATNTTKVKSFDSDGFTLGTSGSVNVSGDTYVAWNWKAGTSFTNDASATGIGTIDSTGSVSQEAGFSIISYTGNGTANQSVAHGLGATPKIILIKNRTTAGYWCMTNPRFVSVSDPNILYLQTTAAEADDTNINGTTAPSSTVFGVDDYGAVNTSGNAHIAYCFTPIQGYSSMGTYVGNGSSDGSYIHLGFKPAFVMIKKTSGTGNWCLFDNKRGVNGAMIQLNPDNTNADNTLDYIDFLAQGFKCRNTASDKNASGGSYIYMAFAENPFVASNFNAATAR